MDESKSAEERPANPESDPPALDASPATPDAGPRSSWKPAENRQELRLALAMRGGASMAVWIGGAASEIEHLRRAMSDAPELEPSTSEESESSAGQPRSEHPWGALARLAGYDSVTVDVLAGASAGGLNGSLLAAALVYGLRFDSTRDMWLGLADLEAMARPVPKLWQPAPPSLLEGDEYFREQVRQKILTGAGPLDARSGRGRVHLLLTATLLDAIEDRHGDDRLGPIIEERRKAWLRFRHQGRAGDPLSDFGAGEEFPRSAAQLAHAARTTSSYPFAFEPALTYSRADGAPAGQPNMFGLFSESAPAGAPPWRVIDGGLLDNIPVTDAIHAIAGSVSDRPTKRWLLYLNPDPVATQEKRPVRWRSALPVALTSLRAKLDQESLLGDLDVLDAHNRTVERVALRRRSLFARLRSADPGQRRAELGRESAAVRDDHAVIRAELDAQAVFELLSSPAGTEDGRMLPPVVHDPLAAWSAPARRLLPEHLSARWAEHASASPHQVFADVRALQSAIEECLGWCRDAERWSSPAGTREIGQCKAALYRLKVLADVLEGHADRYWTAGAELEPIVEAGELDGWVDRVLRRRRRLQHFLPSPIQPLLGAVLAKVSETDGMASEEFQRALAEFAAELLSIMDSSGADAVADDGIADADGGHVDVVAEATDALHGIVHRLAQAVPERTHFDEPEQIGYALLEGAADDDRPAVLHELVVLTAPLDVGRSPGAHITFQRVASDSQSPLPFTALRGEPDGPLLVRNKVRGTDLNHFGAFASAKWRANDWMWGRLDSASSLVRLFVDPERLVRYQPGPEQLGDQLQAIVSRPTPAELGALSADRTKQWRDFLARLWADHAGDVRAELEGLFADPEAEHELPVTRNVLTERMHWTIAASEIPVTGAVSSGAQPTPPPQPSVPSPKRLQADVNQYDVGRQRLPDLGEKHLASTAIRLGLIAYRAVLPGRLGVLNRLGRLALTVIKPLVMVALLALSAPLRTSAALFFGGTSLLLAGGGGFPARWSSSAVSADPLSIITPSAKPWWLLWDFGPPSLSVVHFLAALVVLATSALLGWHLAGRLSSAGGLARWLPALVVAAVLLAVVGWIASTGFRLMPLAVAVVVVVSTWVLAFAYRQVMRAVAAVLTAVSFAVVLSLGGSTVGVTTLAVAAVVAAYAQMLLLGVVDVLPPRPRAPEPDA